MMKRLLRRFSGIVTLLSGAGLTSVPLVVSAVNQSTSESNAPSLEKKQPESNFSQVATTTVKNDVKSTWNYACQEYSSDCPPNWTSRPTVAFGLAYSTSRASSAYGDITSWVDYQYNYFTTVESDYASIIHDLATFKNYYLGPHNANETDPERIAWNGIYNSLNPVIKENYERDTADAITNLLNTSVSLNFRITNLPANGYLDAAGANQDYMNLLVGSITRDALLEQAKAQSLVLNALYDGNTAPPDLTNPLQDALNTKINAALSDHPQIFNTLKSSVESQFLLIDDAAKILDTEEKRTAYEQTMRYFYLLGSGSFNAPLSAQAADDLSDMLGRIDHFYYFIDLNWSAVEMQNWLSADRLKALFNAVSYTPTEATDATTLSAELYNFGDAISKVNSVSAANAYLPVNPPSDFYGPYAAALFLTSLASVTNLNSALSTQNPTLSELLNQYNELAESGKFSDADLLEYLTAALNAFQAGQPISPALADLIAKANDSDKDADAIKDALDKIKNEGLNSDTFAELLKQLNILADISGQVTGYVFIGVGGALALIAVGSGYTLLRGFSAKRKYGVSLAEYARSKNMLVAVAVTAAALAVALIVIASSGVI